MIGPQHIQPSYVLGIQCMWKPALLVRANTVELSTAGSSRCDVMQSATHAAAGPCENGIFCCILKPASALIPKSADPSTRAPRQVKFDARQSRGLGRPSIRIGHSMSPSCHACFGAGCLSAFTFRPEPHNLQLCWVLFATRVSEGVWGLV